MSERMTVAGAYAKIESHEELCAERYKRIDEGLSRLDGAIGGHRKIALGVIGSAAVMAASVMGWMGVQLFEVYRDQITGRPAVIDVPPGG